MASLTYNSGATALPIIGPKEGPKNLPIGGLQRDPRIGENILDHDLDEGDVHNPMSRVETLTGYQIHQNLAEAQMEGGFAFSGNGYSRSTAGSSKQTRTAPKPLNCAPPQTVRVVRFPKEDIEPTFVLRRTIDVKADRHHGDAKLGHIPDFREDWGHEESWKEYRKAYYVFVAPQDVPEEKLHGLYVVFVTYDPCYKKSTHRLIEGYGRHIYEDIFIAKIERYPDGNRWTNYVNMPDEFLSATTKGGRKLYACRLAETNNSMIGAIFG